MNEHENTTPVVEEEDVLLPDGWQEGDDIFAESEWTGETQTDAPAEEPAPREEEAAEAPTEAPTTEQTEAEGEEAREEEAPTTEQEPAEPNKLKFKAKVDHEEIDVELDESDLPTVYQKASATDRYQKKLADLNPTLEKLTKVAKALGFDDPIAMLDNAEQNYMTTEVNRLVGEGVHEEVAKDMVARRVEHAPVAASKPEAPPAAEPQSPTRDFGAEVRELVATRPDLAGKQLPKEVINACAVGGKNLLVAYAEYEAKQAKAEADKARRESAILKQNAASAARAPVSGTQGGGATDTKAKDDFLLGFDSDY